MNLVPPAPSVKSHLRSSFGKLLSLLSSPGFALMSRSSLLRCWWIALALLAGACSRARGAEEVIAITDVTVIDGTGAPAREGQTVVVRGRRIVEVGPGA